MGKSAAGHAADHHHEHHEHHDHATPIQRLRQLLYLDRKELYVLLCYTIITGLLALVVPVAAQMLVNTIAAGMFIQPLVVLTLAVFVGLILVGILRLLQLKLVDVLQQRIFARVALELAAHLPRVKQAAMEKEYGPELVNRFFDTLTVQKAFSKLLLDGILAVLQVMIGLVLLAIYDPVLLAFDVFVIVFVVFVTAVLGIGGLRTSIEESKKKYSVAEWLEELARCQVSFKMSGMPRYLTERTDRLVVEYIEKRRLHFRVIWRQAMGSYLFEAIASAGILAIGGWLVINKELTLGQLVAAEIIVVAVLAAIEKLISQFEQVYDLLTGLDKIGHVTDLPAERSGGRPLPPAPTGGASVVCRGIRFSYAPNREVLSGVDLTLKPGERVSLVGASGAGKSTLAALLCGLHEPSHGSIEINGMEVYSVELESLREAVALVDDSNEIFPGTVEENIVLGRDVVSHEDIRWALEITQLTEEISKFPDGLKTKLVGGGVNLSRGQMQRLMIARAIADHPSLLILDEAFTGIDEKTKLKMLDAIYDPANPWTIIDISHDAQVVLRSATIHVMAQGKVVESSTAEELAWRRNSEFANLFPEVARQILGRRARV